MEGIVAKSGVLSRHLTAGAEKTTKHLSQNSRSPDQDLNRGPPE
jgi:hypothetical protein